MNIELNGKCKLSTDSVFKFPISFVYETKCLHSSTVGPILLEVSKVLIMLFQAWRSSDRPHIFTEILAAEKIFIEILNSILNALNIPILMPRYSK